MECPKCHRNISDNATSCPHCHKVLTLVCPNCKSLGQDAVCPECGYIILEKCSKCGRTIATSSTKCKCGFPTSSSIAYQECELDEFASVTINFENLKQIKKLLGSNELYTKFKFKLTNLLSAQTKGLDCKIIKYGDISVINFNKELSFHTSVNKAIRLSLKIVNAFTHLNSKLLSELGCSLKLSITIQQKSAEELLIHKTLSNKIKPLNIKGKQQKYLRGMQVILDQYVQDALPKEYKTDSLYSVEENGNSIIFYELVLENYVLPPSENTEEQSTNITPQELKKQQSNSNTEDLYSFKVFDINAKCNFKKAYTSEVLEFLNKNKIVCFRSKLELMPKTSDILNFYETLNLPVLYANCSEEVCYKPWGLFEKLFKEFLKISSFKGLIPQDINAGRFNTLKHLVLNNARKAASSEDARFGYFEDFTSFFNSLKGFTIIIDGFEHIDDSSIQALEFYFDKYKKIIPNFVFITDSETSAHSKIKSLLRTDLYTEISIQENSIDVLLSELKTEASDFIQSFYFEKIKEYFNGSKLYFDNAIKYLIEKDILINFDNKLIIKNNNSVIIPSDLNKLIRARLKDLSKNEDASMILAYSALLGERIDVCIFEKLDIKNIDDNIKFLINAGFASIKDDFIYINNFNILQPVIMASLKKETLEYFVKNILAKFSKDIDDTTKALLMGKIGLFKEEYMLLWKNSQFAMTVGDFDAYLKNSLGFLSIINQIKNNISEEDIEEHKKEVYKNILLSLYSYSPAKIYSIENILLADAIKKGDDNNIVKLSNLMLQGALISSNYKDALSLLHNILERFPSPKLVSDGVINTKFLLLSLVNIEILFNIGEFRECIEIANDLLKILTPDAIKEIKPANFSIGLFVNHIMDTFRLVSIAKIITCDSDMENYFGTIKNALGEDLPDKECIMTIKDFLSGKEFGISDIENIPAFSKVIFLILQEFARHSNDYKIFAQNIYQAKLLAEDIHQIQLTLMCDLFIGEAYANIGITKKAQNIFEDVLDMAETHAIFNIDMLAKYFIAKLKLSNNLPEEGITIINDALAEIQNRKNQATILYALFEKMFVDAIKNFTIHSIDVESEEQKLEHIKKQYNLALILDDKMQMQEV